MIRDLITDIIGALCVFALPYGLLLIGAAVSPEILH